MSSGRDQVARSQIEALRAELSSLRICVEELTSRVERLEESAEAEKYEFVKLGALLLSPPFPLTGEALAPQL